MELENKQEKEQKQQLPIMVARNVPALTMREDHVSSKNAEVNYKLIQIPILEILFFPKLEKKFVAPPKSMTNDV